VKEISIKKAVLINFVAKYSNIIVQILLNAVLARILTPEDFGVVAIINVFISFFSIIADLGIGPAIIQNKTLRRREINDIFSFTFYVAIIIAVGFIIFSFPLSIVYKNGVYLPLGALLSIGIFFNTLNMVPNALLLKSKKFKELGFRTVVITIASGVITALLAYNGLKYYALVINSIVSGFLLFTWNYLSVNLKFKFLFKKESILKVRDFSSFQFCFNVINYFARNLDNLLIGKYMNSSALGYYDKAYKLMLYPVQNLTFVITPVLHPILSEYQDNKKIIYENYIKIVKLLSLIGIFVSVFCYFAADEIIIIMFGSQWIYAIPCFKILSISIWAQMITSSSGVIFQSLGKTRLLFISGLGTTFVSICAIILGVISGNLEIVSICVAIAYNIHFLFGFYMLIKHGFKYKYGKFLAGFLPEICMVLIMCVVMSVCNFKIDNVLISGVIKFAICTIIYIIALIVTKQFKVLQGILKRGGR
jgi:PST family polysaccharide transporter